MPEKSPSCLKQPYVTCLRDITSGATFAMNTYKEVEGDTTLFSF